MKRRSALRYLLGFSAASVAGARVPVALPATPERRVGGLIEEIMRAGTEHFRLGRWTIFWTGWKYSACSIDCASQWVALPTDLDGNGEGARIALYVSMPGSAGTVYAGEHFDIGWSPHTQCPTYGSQAEHPSGEALNACQRNGLIVLLDMVRATGLLPYGPYLARAKWMDDVWPILGDRAQWWIDPRRFLQQRGFNPDTIENEAFDKFAQGLCPMPNYRKKEVA